jgi:hypothetical protein
MLGRRRCVELRADGLPCGSPPMRDSRYCFWHNPDTTEQATEARQLGVLRRRRERAVAGAFEFEGLGSIDSIRRVVEIATIDALGLENSIARGRLLISAALAAIKLLEVGEMEARLTALEATQRSREGRLDEHDAFSEDAA